PRHALKPGSYTDDTQMSLAIAEALIAGDRWTPKSLADRFVEAYRRDPREGYSKRFYAFLQAVTSGPDFLDRIDAVSDKSGAAMRAPPLGVLPSIGQVVEKGRVQAALTHNTPDGINAALAAALMTHYFLYDLGPKSRLGEFLESEVPGQWSVPYASQVEEKGWMSVRAAITALVRNNRFDELLLDCVNFTGDVDTVAAIALAAASCCSEYDQELPDKLVRGLENGKYGRDYLIEIDRQLMLLRG